MNISSDTEQSSVLSSAYEVVLAPAKDGTMQYIYTEHNGIAAPKNTPADLMTKSKTASSAEDFSRISTETLKPQSNSRHYRSSSLGKRKVFSTKPPVNPRNTISRCIPASPQPAMERKNLHNTTTNQHVIAYIWKGSQNNTLQPPHGARPVSAGEMYNYGSDSTHSTVGIGKGPLTQQAMERLKQTSKESMSRQSSPHSTTSAHSLHVPAPSNVQNKSRKFRTGISSATFEQNNKLYASPQLSYKAKRIVRPRSISPHQTRKISAGKFTPNHSTSNGVATVPRMKEIIPKSNVDTHIASHQIHKQHVPSNTGFTQSMAALTGSDSKYPQSYMILSADRLNLKSLHTNNVKDTSNITKKPDLLTEGTGTSSSPRMQRPDTAKHKATKIQSEKLKPGSTYSPTLFATAYSHSANSQNSQSQHNIANNTKENLVTNNIRHIGTTAISQNNLCTTKSIESVYSNENLLSGESGSVNKILDIRTLQLVHKHPKRKQINTALIMIHSTITPVNPEGAISNFRIMFKDDKKQFSLGEEVEGSVTLDVWTPIRVSNIELVLHGRGSLTPLIASSYLRRPRHEIYINQKSILTESDSGDTLLQPGHYVSTFTMRIPEHAPPSIPATDLGKGNVLEITYTLRAYIYDRPKQKNEIKLQHEKTKVIKSTKQIVTLTSLLQHMTSSETSVHTERGVSGCCCQRSPATMSLQLEQHAYAINQQIHCKVHVYSNNEIKKISVQLQQKIIIRADKIKKWERVVAKADYSSRQKGHVYEATVALPVPGVIPSQLLHCRLVDVTYMLQVTVHFGWSTVSPLKSSVPVSIITDRTERNSPTKRSKRKIVKQKDLDIKNSPKLLNIPGIDCKRAGSICSEISDTRTPTLMLPTISATTPPNIHTDRFFTNHSNTQIVNHSIKQSSHVSQQTGQCMELPLANTPSSSTLHTDIALTELPIGHNNTENINPTMIDTTQLMLQSLDTAYREHSNRHNNTDHISRDIEQTSQDYVFSNSKAIVLSTGSVYLTQSTDFTEDTTLTDTAIASMFIDTTDNESMTDTDNETKTTPAVSIPSINNTTESSHINAKALNLTEQFAQHGTSCETPSLEIPLKSNSTIPSSSTPSISMTHL